MCQEQCLQLTLYAFKQQNVCSSRVRYTGFQGLTRLQAPDLEHIFLSCLPEVDTESTKSRSTIFSLSGARCASWHHGLRCSLCVCLLVHGRILVGDAGMLLLQLLFVWWALHLLKYVPKAT